MEGAAKFTWQQGVCRAIIGLSKGEAWHMEPAEGAAAKPPLVYIYQSKETQSDREERNGYPD